MVYIQTANNVSHQLGRTEGESLVCNGKELEHAEVC